MYVLLYFALVKYAAKTSFLNFIFIPCGFDIEI